MFNIRGKVIISLSVLFYRCMKFCSINVFFLRITSTSNSYNGRNFSFYVRWGILFVCVYRYLQQTLSRSLRRRVWRVSVDHINHGRTLFADATSKSHRRQRQRRSHAAIASEKCVCRKASCQFALIWQYRSWLQQIIYWEKVVDLISASCAHRACDLEDARATRVQFIMRALST